MPLGKNRYSVGRPYVPPVFLPPSKHKSTLQILSGPLWNIQLCPPHWGTEFPRPKGRIPARELLLYGAWGTWSDFNQSGDSVRD